MELEDSDRIINLNVGGIFYATSLSTMLKYSDSMLARMFSGQWRSKVDDGGRYFIDADGDLFKYIMNYLRRGRLFLPKTFDEVQLDQLLGEAEYFQIKPLIDEVKNLRSPTPIPTNETSRIMIFISGDEGRYYVNYIYSKGIINEQCYSCYSNACRDLKEQGYESTRGILEIRELDIGLAGLLVGGHIDKECADKIKQNLRGIKYYEIYEN